MTRERFWTKERDAEFRSLMARLPQPTKPELAAHFGVTTNAINGVRFRLGYTKANKRRKVVLSEAAE